MKVEESFRRLWESAPDALVIVDEDGRIVLVNSQTERWFGYRREELLGQPIERLIPERFRDAHEQHRQIYFADPRGRPMGTGLELLGRRRDGTEFPVDVSLSPSPTDDGLEIICAIRDVTERKERLKDMVSFPELNPGPVLRFDPGGAVLSANSAAKSILGVHDEQSVGVASVIPGITKVDLAGCIRQGATIKHEEKVGERHFEFTLVGFPDLGLGHIYGTDITERKRAEQALQQSEARYADLYDNAPDMYVSVDTSTGRIVHCNRTLADNLGFTKDEVRGRPIFDLYAAESHAAARATFRQFVETGEVHNAALRLMRRDGSTIDVILNATAVRDETGRILYSRSSCRDVSDLRRSEEALRKLSRAVEQSANIVLITDTEGKIEYVNPRTTAITGYTTEELIGEKPSIFKSGATQSEEYERLWATITAGHEWRGEFQNRKKSGEPYWVAASISPVKDAEGTLTHFLAVQDDVTERKRAEEALARYAAELKRSNAELEQFAYVASHDLQEPLRMVVSYLQLLERRYKDRLEGDAEEFISYAVEGGRRMQVLINDLLHYSRVGRHGEGREPTDCGAVFDAVLRSLDAAIQESGASITCDPLPTVEASASELTQLFQNLVGNALKFRGDDPPRIHASALRKEDEWVFSVGDNGIGIDPHYHERIFTVFQRLHSRSQYPGTGIGLALCKKIVESRGGRIWVESKPGAGSTFYFTILHRAA